MGLFDAIGDGIKGLFGEGFGDRAAIAGAMLDGDYGGAAKIRQSQSQRKLDEADAAQKKQLMLHAYSAAKAMGMTDDEAITIASDPSKAADFIGAWRKPHDAGPEGGSRENPITGKISSMPRWDGDGNYYAPNADASHAPERLVKGIKPVVTQGYGSKVYGWDSQSPEGFVDQNAGQGATGPQPGAIEDGRVFKGGDPADPRNWQKLGGPSLSGSGGFPF